MGAMSLSRCCQAVVFVADNTLEQDYGQQQNRVYINSTPCNILKVHHMERHAEGVSGVLDDMDTVCSSDNQACRQHKGNRILQAWLNTE